MNARFAWMNDSEASGELTNISPQSPSQSSYTSESAPSVRHSPNPTQSLGDQSSQIQLGNEELLQKVTIVHSNSTVLFDEQAQDSTVSTEEEISWQN
jgi:hypothetical protein